MCIVVILTLDLFVWSKVSVSFILTLDVHSERKDYLYVWPWEKKDGLG